MQVLSQVGKKWTYKHPERDPTWDYDTYKSLKQHLLRLMIDILHYLKDPKLWEFWYSPYTGHCRIYITNCQTPDPPT